MSTEKQKAIFKQMSADYRKELDQLIYRNVLHELQKKLTAETTMHDVVGELWPIVQGMKLADFVSALGGKLAKPWLQKEYSTLQVNRTLELARENKYPSEIAFILKIRTSDVEQILKKNKGEN